MNPEDIRFIANADLETQDRLALLDALQHQYHLDGGASDSIGDKDCMQIRPMTVI